MWSLKISLLLDAWSHDEDTLTHSVSVFKIYGVCDSNVFAKVPFITVFALGLVGKLH